MIIKQCTKCGHKVIYPNLSHAKRGSKTGLCRSCYLDDIMRKKGNDSQCWKGGSYIEPEKGYRMIHNPTHYRARKNGYVLEHILIMEKFLGRPIDSRESIHHINGNPADNRIENLKLVKSQLEHMSLHPKTKTFCIICGNKHLARGFCQKHYWTHFLKKHRSLKR